jgi:translocon-associated protein subunit alpha
MARPSVLLLALLLLSPAVLFSLLGPVTSFGTSSLLIGASAQDVDDEDPLLDEDEEDEEDYFGEDEDDYDDDLDDVGASQDASIKIVFPGRGNSAAGQAFPAGSKVSTVIGFQNAGSSAFTVNLIQGFFRHPQDANVIMQNFSGVVYNASVAPGEEQSFSYDFQPSANIFAGTDLTLDLAVTYSTEDGAIFQDAAYNQTITILDPEDYIDNQTWLLMAGSTIAAVFFVYWKFEKSNVKSYEKASSRKIERGTESFDSDFIPSESRK